MNSYLLAIIVGLLVAFWLLRDTPASFTDHDRYFMGNISNDILSDYIIQPRLIHKINIPQEW